MCRSKSSASVGVQDVSASVKARVSQAPSERHDERPDRRQQRYHATISAAVAAAQAGDTIDVASGTYVNDHAVINVAVTIVGVGGMVNLVDTAPPPDEKGIFTVNADATIENIAFSGAATDPGMGSNGAGIRYQSGNLTLLNDDFHDNQDGMLATPAVQGTGTIVIQGCTFDHNGIGDGQTHNLYVGNVATLDGLEQHVHQRRCRARAEESCGN